jgi:quercetin dioxygenase-like cupin family protein
LTTDSVAAPHSHDAFDETIYGLEGVLTWTIDGTPTDVPAGEAFYIPPGAVHSFDNTSEVDAKALAIVRTSPASARSCAATASARFAAKRLF